MTAVPVAPSQHVPTEPHDPTQDWADPRPTTLTCSCGLTFTGATLLEATGAFSGHQYQVVPVGTVLDTSARPLSADEMCGVCETRPAIRVIMGPLGPAALCGDAGCNRLSPDHLGRLPADIWRPAGQ